MFAASLRLVRLNIAKVEDSLPKIYKNMQFVFLKRHYTITTTATSWQVRFLRYKMMHSQMTVHSNIVDKYASKNISVKLWKQYIYKIRLTRT